LIRHDSGHFTEAEQLQFDAWVCGSTLHRVAFLRLELAWEEAGRLVAFGAGIAEDLPLPPVR
jgi:transmembrane sensor